MKKITLILAVIFLCAALISCGSPGGENTESSTSGHTHTATGGWERNEKEHWQICEDGEKLNVAAHTFDEEAICVVCKSMVDIFDDGSVSINTYDEQNNLIRYTYCEADGTLVAEYLTEYAQDSEGNYYEKKTTEYDYVDGVIYIGEFNEYADQISRTITDLEGNIQQKDRYEREYDADGKALWEKTYTNDVLVWEITGYKTYTDGDYFMRFPESMIEYNEDGSKLVTEYNNRGEVGKETSYKTDGTVETVLDYVYEYDAEDNYKRIQVYENERLFKDSEYAVSADGWSYVTKETEYHENGTKTVREYNENDELIAESQYDADGNLT